MKDFIFYRSFAEAIDEPNYFDVVLWGRQGEALNQYLLKGKSVGIDGELRQDRWEQDGRQRSKVETERQRTETALPLQNSNAKPRTKVLKGMLLPMVFPFNEKKELINDSKNN